MKKFAEKNLRVEVQICKRKSREISFAALVF